MATLSQVLDTKGVWFSIIEFLRDRENHPITGQGEFDQVIEITSKYENEIADSEFEIVCLLVAEAAAADKPFNQTNLAKNLDPEKYKSKEGFIRKALREYASPVGLLEERSKLVNNVNNKFIYPTDLLSRYIEMVYLPSYDAINDLYKQRDETNENTFSDIRSSSDESINVHDYHRESGTGIPPGWGFD